ncbi:protein tyrosine kinase [Fragilaria crotonensis]|nr:protein tyrosine kinase [Fragilaria crotonensis]
MDKHKHWTTRLSNRLQDLYSKKRTFFFNPYNNSNNGRYKKSTTRRLDSYWYNHGQVNALKQPDDMRTRDTCVYLAEWQHAYHPSCNDIHAVDLASTSSSSTTTSTLVNHGAYRDVWKITDNNIRTGQGSNDTSSQPQYRVLKTLRYHKRRMFDLRNFDRHRRDAMAFQELQSSRHVMDIYGHCANSALFDYSDGGDLRGLFDSGSKRHGRNNASLEDDTLSSNSTTSLSSAFLQSLDNNNDEQDQDDEPRREQPTKFQLLQIAHSIASAVADAHHVDSLGRPTMAHTDIKPDQWILVSSSSSKSMSSSHTGTSSSDDSKNDITTPPLFQYQLGDFNRARFLTWDTVNNETCPFHVNVNGGPWRSPEEYNHENQTEKGDIWSLGNVLYFLISGGNIHLVIWKRMKRLNWSRWVVIRRSMNIIMSSSFG